MTSGPQTQALSECPTNYDLDLLLPNYLNSDTKSFSIDNYSPLQVFSCYCRIHESVEIASIAERMQMSPSQAEAWIVQLIMSGKLSGAVIDHDEVNQAGGRVYFPQEPTSVHQQVCDRTKNMAFRLYLLQKNCEGMLGKKKVASLDEGVVGQVVSHLN